MMKTLGNKHKKAITIPFRIEGSCKFEVASTKPETTQRKNAERLASQVYPCKTIGTRSINPVPTPRSTPTRMFFFILDSFAAIL